MSKIQEGMETQVDIESIHACTKLIWYAINPFHVLLVHFWKMGTIQLNQWYSGMEPCILIIAVQWNQYYISDLKKCK
jgi:hypothetical protein